MTNTTGSSSSSWDAYNDLLLYGSPDRFTKLLSRYELFRRVIELPGDIVECGVFKGAGLLYWAKLIQIFNPLSCKKVIGFDTFSDFPAETESDRKFATSFVADSGYIPPSAPELMQIAERQGLAARVELVAGDASITIGQYVSERPGFRVCLLNLDFDIARPTKFALDCLYDLVVPGGVIAFDEYGIHACSEAEAVDEFFRGRSIRLRSIPWNLSPTAYCVKE